MAGCPLNLCRALAVSLYLATACTGLLLDEENPLDPGEIGGSLKLSDIPENLLPEGFELPINSEGFFDLKRSADASESGSNPKMDMLTALATRVMKKQSQELEPVIPQYIFLRKMREEEDDSTSAALETCRKAHRHKNKLNFASDLGLKLKRSSGIDYLAKQKKEEEERQPYIFLRKMKRDLSAGNQQSFHSICLHPACKMMNNLGLVKQRRSASPNPEAAEDSEANRRTKTYILLRKMRANAIRNRRSLSSTMDDI